MHWYTYTQCISEGDGSSEHKALLPPYTVLHLSAWKIPSCWTQHPTWEASSSIFAEQEDLLHVSLSCELTAPQRCVSRLRDLVWMYREFLSCSSKEQLENGEQHFGKYFKDKQTPAFCLCQLTHTEKWSSCTNLQSCAQHKLWRETIYPNPPMLQSQKGGEKKAPEVQMQILQVTNSTLPMHPHCIRYWTLTQTPYTE